jgi:hypothetical protein
VEVNLLTVVSGARNAAVLVAAVADAVLVAAAGVEVGVELLLVLELPHPASTKATPARARIDGLCTVYLLSSGIGGSSAAANGSLQSPRWFP